MDGFSVRRPARLRGLLERSVDAGLAPGLVVAATGRLAFEGAGSSAGDQRRPMWSDFWTTIYQAIDG